jgi:hypothetical protein
MLDEWISDHPQILGFVANVTGILNVSSVTDVGESHLSGKNLYLSEIVTNYLPWSYHIDSEETDSCTLKMLLTYYASLFHESQSLEDVEFHSSSYFLFC